MREFHLASAVVNGANRVWDVPVPHEADYAVVRFEFPAVGDKLFVQTWAEGPLSGYQEFTTSVEVVADGVDPQFYLVDLTELAVKPTYVRVWQTVPDEAISVPVSVYTAE